MLGLDTNILLRYLTDDHPTLSPRARQIVERRLSVEAPGYINDIVLCELAWTLRSAYRLSRQVIADILSQLLLAPQLRVQGETQLRLALERFAVGPAGFVDCLLAERNHAQGCTETLTFDRDAARLPHMQSSL
jgi:predicted nucleic-acid-binding protein